MPASEAQATGCAYQAQPSTSAKADGKYTPSSSDWPAMLKNTLESSAREMSASGMNRSVPLMPVM